MAFFGSVAMLVRALGSSTGDIDPVGAAVGVSSLVVSVWGALVTVRSARWQETDLADASARLASQVLAVEREARRQLLGGHDRTVDLRFVFRPSAAHSAEGADASGRLTEVADYFQRLGPRRMIVTGAPGAGKTVLAVQLMLYLLERRSADEPVPVRLSLASSESHLSLETWIARHLERVYHLSRQAAIELVTARRVLPVLDGLDELDTTPCPGYGSRSAEAVRSLNAYQQGVQKAELILTCRSETYDALEDTRVWAHDAARIEIQPIVSTEARSFLNSRVDDLARWEDVLDALDRNPSGPLALGLATPWRLTLAATVYEQRDSATGTYTRDPRELLAERLDSVEAVGTHLLDLFIPATAKLFPRHRRSFYPSHHVRDWLTTLARYLDHNAATGRTIAGHRLSGTDILLSRLWPLATAQRPRLTLMVPAVAVSLTGAMSLLALLSTQRPLIAPWPFFTALAIMGVLSAVFWSVAWSELQADEHQYHQRRTFTRRLASGLGWSSLLSVAFVALVVTQGSSLSLAATAGAFVVWVGALGLVFSVPLPHAPENSHPSLHIRSHLIWGLLAPTMVFSELMGAAAMSTGKSAATTLVMTTAGGVAGGLMLTPMLAPTGLWYLSLLLRTRSWTRRPLPWRLGRFLRWCYHAGLVRVAGTAYQFRHRELQDHLARQAPPLT
ncbi:NACHT domain-containing protein [Streptomyces muensis]|uniref:NACHT domain-containing protein n=1 Tax=Streptomyces muensis TaxID=1077944 RepID=A0A9X1Q4I3_STRM4|nr:NACHT domain-containing protein [Streptomyces muensis]MCF1597749.1 NACHT domain-containing protein [Streptomyces muensis]